VILANALAQAKVWQNAGLMLRVAVNLSRGNLVSLEFVDLVVVSANNNSDFQSTMLILKMLPVWQSNSGSRLWP
jgi:EAL domain-containing protein (putative c-di-GMP-specific phosphodiesterase class I)